MNYLNTCTSPSSTSLRLSPSLFLFPPLRQQLNSRPYSNPSARNPHHMPICILNPPPVTPLTRGLRPTLHHPSGDASGVLPPLLRPICTQLSQHTHNHPQPSSTVPLVPRTLSTPPPLTTPQATPQLFSRPCSDPSARDLITACCLFRDETGWMASVRGVDTGRTEQ